MLENKKRGKKFITNQAVNYDILSNPVMMDDFYFV
jgi:hypothetical protein